MSKRLEHVMGPSAAIARLCRFAALLLCCFAIRRCEWSNRKMQHLLAVVWAGAGRQSVRLLRKALWENHTRVLGSARVPRRMTDEEKEQRVQQMRARCWKENTLFCSNEHDFLKTHHSHWVFPPNQGWCKKARKAGFQCWILDDLQIWKPGWRMIE